jgi:peptidoglycan-associated lipoprotein
MGGMNIMKKLALLMILMLAGSCKNKEIVDETPPPPPVVQEKPVEPPPPPPPPPPKPTLKAEQLKTVYFDFDKFALRADSKAALDANYALLTEFPDAIIKIEGHADERGTVEYNIALGDKRANAAKDYLIGLGLAKNRVSTISYGEERPAVVGHDEAAWAKNRRCEFKIVSQ